MDESKRQSYLALKREVERILSEIEDEIIEYSPKASDELFIFKVKKAVYYRDILKRINDELREN